MFKNEMVKKINSWEFEPFCDRIQTIRAKWEEEEPTDGLIWYSPLHKIVWRLFIRDKNLFETLEVSHSMSNLIPLSAKQKGGLLTIDIMIYRLFWGLWNYGIMGYGYGNLSQ
jgi:hypothetical protein